MTELKFSWLMQVSPKNYCLLPEPCAVQFFRTAPARRAFSDRGPQRRPQNESFLTADHAATAKIPAVLFMNLFPAVLHAL